MLKQIACELNFLHQAGIVHRDIKPSNILVVYPTTSTDGKYVWKLADFGISKKLTVADENLTIQRRGSTGWKEAEICSNPTLIYTDAVDVFSTGCVFFYASTNGNHPFGSSRATGVMKSELDYESSKKKTNRKSKPIMLPIRSQSRFLQDLITSMIVHLLQNRYQSFVRCYCIHSFGRPHGHPVSRSNSQDYRRTSAQQ